MLECCKPASKLKSKAMIRPILLSLTLLLMYSLQMSAQSDETVRELPQPAINLYPTLGDMHGYAVGKLDGYLIVFGGTIRSRASETEPYEFPNLDILLIDFNNQRASAYTNGQLEGELGEQMSATGLSYYQKGNTLYLLGGYGYSQSHNQYITFPYITAIDLEATLQALMDGENPVASFYQLCDDRLAIFDGTLDYNGEEFFLLNGKHAYKLQPFAEDAEYIEEKMDDQARTFKLQGDLENLEIKDFQTWYDMEGFEDYYGPLIPDRIREQLDQSKQQRSRGIAQ